MGKTKSKSAPGEPVAPQIVKRSLILLSVAVLLFVGLASRILILQTAGYSKYEQKVIEQITTESRVSATRGRIYDANGNLLADHVTSYRIFLAPHRIAYAQSEANRNGEGIDYGEIIALHLSEVLEVSRDRLREEISKTHYLDRTIARNVNEETADRVRELIRDYSLQSMVGVEAVNTRYYPYGSLAAQTIGFTGSDGAGLYGLEYAYNEQLSGENGRYVTARDARGNAMPDEYEEYIAARPGNDLHTTLDVFVQSALDEQVRTAYIEAGGKNRAAGIVMNVKTGAILGMSTYPDFDLNDPWTLDEQSMQILSESGLSRESEEYAAMRRELLLSMWSNKTITESYIPGSTFKIITAAMALESDVVGLEETFQCSGSKNVLGFNIHCHKRKGHGTLTFVQGIQQSCNPVLMTVGLRLGGDRFYDYLEQFGFLGKTAVDLPGEGGSVLISKENFTDLDLAIYSFGQNFNVTLLQQITAVSSVANGGYLVTPHLVDSITDPDGNVVWKFELSEERKTVSTETCQTVSKILEEGVSGDGGAKNAYVAGYRIAAKTGTSQKKNEGSVGQYVCSTIAYAPADDPQYAVIIIVDEPTAGILYGSTVAAPYVGAVMKTILPHLGVEAVYSAEELEHRAIETPDCRNLKKEDAIKFCRENGLEMIIIGEGELVTSQSPVPGTVLEKESGKIILYFGETISAQTVKVPNVVGKTPAEANKLLVDSGLNVSVNGLRNHSNSAGVQVIAQSIPEGSDLPRGTVVEITLRSLTDEDLDEP
ncbi:MAG: PASTA domain-containing protein [Ruminococcaceae bacterium]|nr:PASTA domain-containing protein [Oscillospiraceae bacterium]